MTSDEIRAAFLNFFESKGHKIIPSSSLIPRGDPTLLLTTAGMVQFKPYFLGKEVPPKPRLASCQKCFRTTDIESVGDATHLTFFEMLGNFSIGDYFKREAISWAWEFVTQYLKLDTKRLWVTVFLDDDEAFGIWREIGVPEVRIVRCGEKDNFWGPAGNSGPCGPCSEIHYDFGAEFGCGQDSCVPNCGCGRFSEIWNLVFTQYNQDEAGNRTLLPKPNIDTGMGLERAAAVVQGKTNVYETDLFAPLLEFVSGMTGKEYGADVATDTALRIIAEHGRGITFLIADGVFPGNEGRGYVLRRLLRRAVLFGRKLGLEGPFLSGVAEFTIKQMGRVYPEIVRRQGFISRVIAAEETRFNETLGTGLELLAGIMEQLAANKETEISGQQVFNLYDTYGFPVELTGEIAAERGFTVDLAGFEREMAKQRARARAAQVFGLGVKEGLAFSDASSLHKDYSFAITPFIGYGSLSCESTVFGIVRDGTLTESIAEGQQAAILLEQTPFYAEMGGQVGDTGEIRGPSGRFLVTNTLRILFGVVHQGHMVEGSLAVEEKVVASVDVERRLDIARNHTATHLLQVALRQVLGEHVQQRGSLVTPEQFRFDFSHLAAMTAAELAAVQRQVNEMIRQNLKAYDVELSYDEAIAEGAMALFDEKYGDVVRVMKIGEPVVSAELCGGTHVTATGEIGMFQIVSEMSIGAGLRRILAVTGRGAEKHIAERLSALESVAQSLDVAVEEVTDKLPALLSDLGKERHNRLTLERELAKITAESLLSKVEVVDGVTLLVAKVASSRLEILREMSDLIRERLGSAVIVLGSIYEDKPVFLAAVTPDLVDKGYNAGEIVKQVAKVTGGGGGGKARLGQAGGKYKDKLDEALAQAKKFV